MGDIRCPRYGKLLFAINGPVIEIACRDCRQQARKHDPDVFLVLHKVLFGEVVETQTLYLQPAARVRVTTTRGAAAGHPLGGTG